MKTDLSFTAFVLAISLLGLGTAQSAEPIEQDLLKTLTGPAAKSEKALACKRLAIHGSSEAVPHLAKLLPDSQLASWARIALEAIPGEESAAALRNAAQELDGKLLVGVINSLAVLRDSGSIEILAGKLGSEDPLVAGSAAAALGKIGSEAAAKPLREALASDDRAVRNAAAEGCVLCAEQLQAGGKLDQAMALFDQVRKADVAQPRRLEAIRGAILARKAEGIPLLVDLLQAEDKHLYRLGLTTAREMSGSEVDAALAAELQQAVPARAAMIVRVMADRPQTVQLKNIVAAAQAGPQEVRQVAIEALGSIGDATCLAVLLASAIDTDNDVRNAARQALARLPGDGVDAQIVDQLKAAKGESYPVLIELVGQRRIAAVPALLQALRSKRAEVRSASLTALGETVGPDQLSILIEQVLSPGQASDREVAERALKAAAVRMPDREACAAELATAADKIDSIALKSSLLQILGAVGGKKSLSTIGAAARSADPTLQDISSRLLGQWMTADAAPVLLDLSSEAPAEKYRIRALRGYIRIARQFVIPEAERAEMCAQALEVASRPAEQKLVLDVLKRYPNRETLRLAIAAAGTPAIKNEANQTTLFIAQKLGRAADIKKLLATAGLGNVKVEIIKAEYGAGSTQKDVTALVRKHADDSPLILLDNQSYNASLGGDPVPGTPKKLRIKYRLDGRAGDASFEENSIIVLPVPN